MVFRVFSLFGVFRASFFCPGGVLSNTRCPGLQGFGEVRVEIVSCLRWGVCCGIQHVLVFSVLVTSGLKLCVRFVLRWVL